MPRREDRPTMHTDYARHEHHDFLGASRSALTDGPLQAGRLHWVTPREDTRRIVAGIATASGCRRIVKPKSITTAEIHPNPALEAAGLEVTETDFGEYIIQRAGERPSHLVAPAVHHTRESIARVLSEHLKEELPDEPHALAQAGRRVLREKFRTADMGLSG